MTGQTGHLVYMFVEALRAGSNLPGRLGKGLAVIAWVRKWDVAVYLREYCSLLKDWD